MAQLRQTPLAELLLGVGQALAEANSRLTRANAPALLSTATVELNFAAQAQARHEQLFLAGFRQAPPQLAALGGSLTNGALRVTAIAAPSLTPARKSGPVPPQAAPGGPAPGSPAPRLGAGIAPLPASVTGLPPLPPPHSGQGRTGPITPPPRG